MVGWGRVLRMVGGRSLQIDTGLGWGSGVAGEGRQEQTLSKGAGWGGRKSRNHRVTVSV